MASEVVVGVIRVSLMCFLLMRQVDAPVSSWKMTGLSFINNSAQRFLLPTAFVTLTCPMLYSYSLNSCENSCEDSCDSSTCLMGTEVLQHEAKWFLLLHLSHVLPYAGQASFIHASFPPQNLQLLICSLDTLGGAFFFNWPEFVLLYSHDCNWTLLYARVQRPLFCLFR